jgi:hypothetical protein
MTACSGGNPNVAVQQATDVKAKYLRVPVRPCEGGRVVGEYLSIN